MRRTHFLYLQMPIKQMADKRQLTVLLICSKAGTLLPPHLIDPGKTDRCHTSYDFPKDWDIYYTET